MSADRRKGAISMMVGKHFFFLDVAEWAISSVEKYSTTDFRESQSQDYYDL